MRLTRRISEAAKILQIQFLDHLIIGQPMGDRQGYFSFKEGGAIGQTAKNTARRGVTGQFRRSFCWNQRNDLLDSSGQTPVSPFVPLLEFNRYQVAAGAPSRSSIFTGNLRIRTPEA